jgi:hypothetical protein
VTGAAIRISILFSLCGCASQLAIPAAKTPFDQVRVPKAFTANVTANQTLTVNQAYLEKMSYMIQLRWDRMLIDSKITPPAGTKVVVTFEMNSEGKIINIKNVESTSTKEGEEACIAAVTTEMPYWPWTAEMIRSWGSSKEITFGFYYQ